MLRVPTLKDFEGRWSLTRVIEDRKADKNGSLAGEASFSPDGPGGLIYFEKGKLTYAQTPAMMATRSYLWKAVPGGIEVSFEDNRPFHTIDSDKLMPDADHQCDPDWYHVSYDFTKFPEWSSIWRVKGPAKDYRMVTEYRRS